MNILVFNAGRASLKFEVVSTQLNKKTSILGKELISAIIEGIGENAVLSEQEGKNVINKQQITAKNYEEATNQALEWLDSKSIKMDMVGHRVVHQTASLNQANL